MRVLHVISSIDLRAGGPTAALVGLTTAQAAAGLDVTVLATFAAGENDSPQTTLANAGVKVRLIGPSRGALKRHPQLAVTVAQCVADADVVHIHALWEEIQHQAARAAQRRGVPYIIRPCGMLDPWSLSQSRWRKRIYLALRLRKNLNRAAAIHFTSEIEHDVSAPLKLRPAAIVEPNGVDLREFEQLPVHGTFRARYPELAEKLMVLFLSRVHPKKGLDLLIPAFAAGAPPQATLVIAGPDSDGYTQQVRDSARRHDIADRVIFTGMLYGRQRIEALVDADLFVLPSYQENFGIVVAEALAAGTPVIISDQVNIHREIAAAAVGEVVPTQVIALTEALRRWISGAASRAAAAARAADFVRQRYDWNAIARRWVSHYTALAAGHARF